MDKRIFFVSVEEKAASLLMDKAAVDRGDQIESVHHVQEGMVDIRSTLKLKLTSNGYVDKKGLDFGGIITLNQA